MTGTKLFNTRYVSKSSARDYLRGVGSVMNIRGNTSREYDFAASPAEADNVALENDWIAVGGDLCDAIEICGRR